MAIVSEQTSSGRLRRGSLLLLLLLATIAAITSSSQLGAQPITVATQVFPPYSPYLSDYVGFDNKILITLTNSSGNQESVRLVGSISGNNGVNITIPNNYVPNSPIVVPANGVKILKGSDLQNYLNPDNLNFSGITKAEVVQGNGLPEGDYSFCLQALDYNDASVLSAGAPSGCAYFPIAHFAPPETLTPSCEAIIDPTDPQSILFSWTIPPGAPPGDLEYVLTIVEILPENTPPTQAMNAAPNPPFFEKVVTATTTYLYGQADPQLEEGMSYAFRVTAQARQGVDPLAFQNEGESAVCSFTWGGEDDLVENDDDDDENENDENIDLDENYVADCQSLNCAPEAPSQTPSNYTYKVGDEVKVGYFTMKLTELANPSAGNLTGEGTIDAPIFRMQLRTSFTGLKVNPAHRVYEGEAIGAYDPGGMADDALQNFQENMNGVTEEKIEAISSYVEENQKYIEQFVDLDAKGLPFAFSDIVDSKLQLITIAAVKFAPDGARLNAVMEFPIPEAENKVLAFAQKNVCFHPTGLSIDGLQKLTMIDDEKKVSWGPNIELTLEGVGGKNGGTFVKWDCEGFKGIQVDGYFAFDQSLLEKVDGNGEVHAEFTMNAGSWGDLLGEVAMDEFTVAGMKGISFGFDGAILDFSDTRNAQSMDFPEGYQGSQGVDWKGFFFKEITVTLPDYLKKGKLPATITLANGLINRLGFSGKVTAEPLFSIDEGNLGGWGFSIDEFALAFLNNTMTAGEFSGKVELPVSKNGIAYSCLLSNSDQGVATDFSVSYLDELVVDMWGATLTLFEGSTLGIETLGKDVTVEAVLSGELTINKEFPDLKNVSVSIPDVKFQELTIRNKAPYISATSFAFASPEKSFAGFPVSIAPDDGIEIIFKDDGKRAGLALGFQVGLDGNGESAISGGTNFTIWGKMVENDGKQSWTLDKPELNAIWVDASVASCDIKGEINLYNGDEKFGDGFRGALEVTVRPIVSLAATVQFGSTNYKNGNERYRYWYVDGMAVMQAGIPIYPGFGIYGFGGGAYYHMKPVKAVPSAASLKGDPDKVSGFDQDQGGATTSGVTYDPDPDILFGLKATAVLATMPSPNAFNGDITLEASFFEGGGLNQISLGGKGFFATELDPAARPSESKAPIVATADFTYSAAEKTFDGIVDMTLHMKQGNTALLSGGGQAALHFSKNKWFVKFGTPQSPMGLTVLGLPQISTYMMVGKNSLGPLPELPAEFKSQPELNNFNEKNPRDPAADEGTGFAFGQSLNIDTGPMKYLIFYGDLKIDLGYDVTLLEENLECAEAKDGIAGINGWYARGQAYAGIDAEIGLDINLWFVKTQVPILDMGLYASIEAGLPNPTWLKGNVNGDYSALNGLLKGHCTFKFDYGSACKPMSTGGFDGLEVIADIGPDASKASIFSYPEVAYNLPLNKTISVQGVDEEGEATTAHFRFGLRDFTLTKTADKGKMTNIKVGGSSTLHSNNMASLFEPNSTLDEYSSYRIDVSVFGDRYVDGEWIRITKGKGSKEEHLEERTETFKTGKAPERFVESNIAYTRPGQRQRYFYRYDGAPEGFVRFKLFPKTLPTLKPDDPNYTFRYVARFQEIGAGSEVIAETPIEWENNSSAPKATFPIPADILKNEQLYIVQIVRKKVKKIGAGGLKLAASAGGGPKSFLASQKLGDGQSIDVRKQRLDGIKLGDDEFMVYQIAFKTSKHNTLASKVKSYMKKGNHLSTKQGTNAQENTLFARYKGDEPLGWYDLHEVSWTKGSKFGLVERISPLLRIEARDFSGASNKKYWNWLESKYLSLISDPFLLKKIANNVGPNPQTTGPNPRTIRSYPSTGAYLPGSRLTRGSRIDTSLFPRYAVDIRYVGNGHTTKLTDQEINAVFWKGTGTKSGISLYGSKLSIGKKKGGGMNSMVNNLDLKMNEVDIMEIRYDVVTILRLDRKKVADELLYRYTFSASSFNMNANWLSFVNYNYPTRVMSNQNGPNPQYWSMNLAPQHDYPVKISFRDGGSLPGGGEVWLKVD